MGTEVKLQQGSAEWHEWRRKHLGGSDANIIAMYYLKLPSPWAHKAMSELYNLWREKTGKFTYQIQNEAMAHGTRSEAIARDLYSERTGEFVVPTCFERGFRGASLDGWTGQTPIEIKCPTREIYHTADGMFPPHYIGQLQHNLWVCDATSIDYVSYWNGAIHVAFILPDPDFLEQLLEAEDRFWKMVTSDTWDLEEPKLKMVMDQ